MIEYLYIIFREVSIQVLCQILYWTVCLFVVESLLNLLILSFAAHILILIKSHLFIFSFVSLSVIRIHCQIKSHENLPFSTVSFMLLALVFGTLIHFELIFCM